MGEKRLRKGVRGRGGGKGCWKDVRSSNAGKARWEAVVQIRSAGTGGCRAGYREWVQGREQEGVLGRDTELAIN